MFSYDFNFSEFSLIAQSLLSRIDFVSGMLVDLPSDSGIKSMYEKELVSLRSLYDKITLHDSNS